MVQGQNFLIVIDSFSKKREVKHMSSTTSAATIDVLQEIFSSHVMPDTNVSDSGPQFPSSEFQHFFKNNTIKQIFITPNHETCNGQAEKMVQTLKDSLKRIVHGSWKKRLANFLLKQHIIPTSSSGSSPFELLTHPRIETYLDRLHPDLVRNFQEKQKTFLSNQQAKASYIFYSLKDTAFIQNFNEGVSWIPATVIERSSPVS